MINLDHPVNLFKEIGGIIQESGEFEDVAPSSLRRLSKIEMERIFIEGHITEAAMKS